MPVDPVRPAQPRLTTRRILFRLHWAAGLVAGLVLAIVGVTGAMLGFEAEWLAWLNPGYQTPSEGRPTLSADAWIARAQASAPELRPRSLSWSGDDRPVRVRLAAGRDRGVTVALNPYSGKILGPERGACILLVAREVRISRQQRVGDERAHIHVVQLAAEVTPLGLDGGTHLLVDAVLL